MVSGTPISSRPISSGSGRSALIPTGVISEDVVLVLTLTENVRLYDGLRKDNQVVVTLTENVRVRR